VGRSVFEKRHLVRHAERNSWRRSDIFYDVKRRLTIEKRFGRVSFHARPQTARTRSANRRAMRTNRGHNNGLPKHSSVSLFFNRYASRLRPTKRDRRCYVVLFFGSAPRHRLGYTVHKDATVSRACTRGDEQRTRAFHQEWRAVVKKTRVANRNVRLYGKNDSFGRARIFMISPASSGRKSSYESVLHRFGAGGIRRFFDETRLLIGTVDGNRR